MGKIKSVKVVKSAEERAAALGWEFVWEHDELPYETGNDDDRPSEVLVCTLKDGAGTPVAGCGGIGDPDYAYARTMEAELLDEALHHRGVARYERRVHDNGMVISQWIVRR